MVNYLKVNFKALKRKFGVLQNQELLETNYLNLLVMKQKQNLEFNFTALVILTACRLKS